MESESCLIRMITNQALDMITHLKPKMATVSLKKNQFFIIISPTKILVNGVSKPCIKDPPVSPYPIQVVGEGCVIIGIVYDVSVSPVPATLLKVVYNIFLQLCLQLHLHRGVSVQLWLIIVLPHKFLCRSQQLHRIHFA